jgi:hypothetical protein
MCRVAWPGDSAGRSEQAIHLLVATDFMVNDAGIVATGCQEQPVAEAASTAPTQRPFCQRPHLAFNEDGKTTVLEAGREFKVLAENFLEDGFMASPAVDGRALYVRTRTHLYRIEDSAARTGSK